MRLLAESKEANPCLVLYQALNCLLKAFDEVVGDVVLKAPDPDMSDAQHGFHRSFVGVVAIGDNGSGPFRGV